MTNNHPGRRTSAPRPHGNAGNQNAAKYVKPAWLHRIQVEQDFKNACVAQAQRAEMGLNEWIKAQCRSGIDPDLCSKFGIE